MKDTFERLLARTVSQDAADLFLKVGRQPHIRRHGELQAVDGPPITDEHMDGFLAIVLTATQREHFAGDPDLDVAYLSVSGERFRVNCFRQRGHVGLAIRWIRGGDIALDDLHLPPVLARWVERSSGLVIVAGPTGSGKSTTLSAMVAEMNRGRRRHIITIEDPIEYLYEDDSCLIEQREVGYDTNSFSDALRHVVRQAPDVIVIGEMRDLDSMRVALSAAMTGHLVLTTLHTSDAIGTIERVLNYFPGHEQQFVRVELAHCLVGIVCQRLVITADGTGRVPATEVMQSSPLITKYVTEGNGPALADLLNSGRVPDAHSLQQSLIRLVQEEQVTQEEAIVHSPNPDDLGLRLQGFYSGSESIRQQATADELPAEPTEALATEAPSEPPPEPEAGEPKRYTLL